MGSDDACLHPNGFHLSGVLPNRLASLTRVLDLERWTRAEERTAELISHIQPDKPSWEHRNAIASYVQRLIAQCIPCVVFSYGSVPLKTYLPDGDIDLTVFSQDQGFRDNWATEVRDILEKEQKNEDAEYCVSEVQLIHAEVKLVKCLVNNIVVDISFGQLSGLCTLCFLEEVDRHIGQNHLFKRSIILIKAWCYYESRLLGAYHGLISTYALETLILYVFRVFNNSFAGPLEVLYRFLEFFSKFDWDKFCISLLGPVPIESLPDMTVDPPQQDNDTLLLNKRFLHACSLYYSVLPSAHVKEQFVSKHFNIIDFLRTNNNLGRSVSKGNLFRIRSALAFGAQRLAGLLDCPKESVVIEFDMFFVNTWDRHGNVHRPDTLILHELDLGREEPEQIVQKKNIKQTNFAFEKDDVRLNDNQKIGRKGGKSEVLQDEVQFGLRFARTFSSPELMNSHFIKERGKKPIQKSARPRGRKPDNRISESALSGVEDSCNIRFNKVDSSTRENSPSESHDGYVDSASTSSIYSGDHVVAEDISSEVKPLQKSANVMHPSLVQSFHPNPVILLKAPSPEAGLNLNNIYYPHSLPPSSAPIVGRFNNDLQAESSHRQVDQGLWENDVCSSVEHNSENGVLDNEYIERKQNPVTTSFLANIEQNTENGIPLSDAETEILNSGALQFPIPNMNHPTPNWFAHMQHHPSLQTPTFPVTYLPTGLVNPFAFTPPYSTYTGPTLDSTSRSTPINEHSQEFTSDILSGDIATHISNMLYGRSCQSLQFQGPLFYRPSIVPPPYLQGQFEIAINDHVSPETPVMPALHHQPNQRIFKNGNYSHPPYYPMMYVPTYMVYSPDHANSSPDQPSSPKLNDL